jgi:hypothetical protein
MKILHVSPHLGGGVGTVLKGWNDKEKLNIACLEQTNDPRTRDLGTVVSRENLMVMIEDSDIVLVHFWDHKTIFELFAQQIPQCRLIFWSHKNWMIPDHWRKFPDMFINTSPVQGKGQYIWSTGGLYPLERIWNPARFNIGAIISRKTAIRFLIDTERTLAKQIPSAVFTWIGGTYEQIDEIDANHCFLGKVEDIYPYLREMDVLFIPCYQDIMGLANRFLGKLWRLGWFPLLRTTEQRVLLLMTESMGSLLTMKMKRS